MNVLIVDDHPLVCSGIKNIITSEPDMEIILQAHDIQSAINLMDTCRIDLAMVDMRLKDELGVHFVMKAKEKYPDCKFVILSSSSTPQDFDRAIHAEIDGYILKDAYPEDILYAIRTVLRGRKYFDPVFMSRINAVHEPVSPENPEKQLSPRELEILDYLGRGFSNRSISEKLYISENTVKKHVGNILTKLNLSDRTQAALFMAKTTDKKS